ncbi:MAG: C-GCAxxG-C-C family protein [Promethearchaeota archaeon]
MLKKDFDSIFNEKIKELEQVLPEHEGERNGAAWTLLSVLDVLGLKEPFYNNLMIGLGLGGYDSLCGWKSACGVIYGGCAAIGVIIGGKKELKFSKKLRVTKKTTTFINNFEKKFGAITCEQLSGVDFTNPEEMPNYRTNKVWENCCCKYIMWAVNEIRILTSRELNKYWS